MQIEILGEVYSLRKTTAPKTYDAGSVIDFYDDGEGTRYILVSERERKWQEGRNASGMYGLEATDDIPENVVRDTLWLRLLGREEVR